MYWHFSILGIFFILIVLVKVRNKVFSEVKSILWILGAILLSLIPFFPGSITYLSNLAGIVYAPSFLFLIGIIFILIILFRQEQDVSILLERVKELAQKNALLEEKVRRLENKK